MHARWRQVDPSKSYPVRQATAHPVHENWRCATFRQLLALPQGDTNQMRALGELMMQVIGRATALLALSGAVVEIRPLLPASVRGMPEQHTSGSWL